MPTKRPRDEELDRALENTFPASDPLAVDGADREAVRPAGRRTALVDKRAVDALAARAKATTRSPPRRS